VLDGVLIIDFKVIIINHGFVFLLSTVFWLIIATFSLLKLFGYDLRQIWVNNHTHLTGLGVDLEEMLGIQKLFPALLGQYSEVLISQEHLKHLLVLTTYLEAIYGPHYGRQDLL
jgi:hypothetical protein